MDDFLKSIIGGAGAALFLGISVLVISFAIWLYKKFILPKLKKTKDFASAISNHSTEAIKDYVDKHAHSNAQFSSENDNIFYEQAMTEIDEDKKVRAIWGKALANSDGNIDKAKSLYIQMRVQSLKIENKNNITLESDLEKNKELNTIELESSECDMPTTREQEKNFFIKFFYGKLSLWETFFITISILTIIIFVQTISYDVFNEKPLSIIIDTFYFLIICILVISSWNSVILNTYISLLSVLEEAMLFIFFLVAFALIFALMFTLINENISHFSSF